LLSTTKQDTSKLLSTTKKDPSGLLATTKQDTGLLSTAQQAAWFVVNGQAGPLLVVVIAAAVDTTATANRLLFMVSDPSDNLDGTSKLEEREKWVYLVI
jgi:hypothetical protein